MKKTICILGVVLLIAALMIFYGLKMVKNADTVVKRYREAVKNTQYIMHALGGMENKYTYTNSIDALRYYYEIGCRFFELDLSFTSDGQLVCAHSATVDGVENVWRKVEWVKRLGQNYDPEHTLASFDEFMSFTIQGKFKATSFAEIVDFMKEHSDMYIMLDVGNRSYAGTKKIYEQIVNTANGNADVLDRLIVGGHTTDMIEGVTAVYDFPLINLYFASAEERQDVLQDPQAFVDYCLEHGVTSFSTACTTFENEDIRLLTDRLIGYVFTTDDPEEAETIHKQGLIVGTNFLGN